MSHIPSSEITPEQLFWQRRRMFGLPMIAGASAVLAACGSAAPVSQELPAAPEATAATGAVVGPSDELGNTLTPYETVTGYNNYYEFTTDKERVKDVAAGFVTSPWNVVVDGLVAKPRTFGLEDLQALQAAERIYRLRCVEGWSMVIPWSGYSLAELIRKVEPTGNAKFVEFTTLADPAQMPGLGSRVLSWPYVEGLRLDEAMHPLTLLSLGMYGQVLPNQNGAPVRIIVPWKYGFKSAKSIVRIRFTETQPKTAWNSVAPDEYGFYSNVNPEVSHPRWSQATERRIGEDGFLTRKRKTLMFNGYPEVASLYSGMDLKKFY